MNVGWTPVARVQVIECAAHIAADDRSAAARWLHGLIQAVDRLADFPHIGHAVAAPSPERREILYGNYTIRYRVDESVTVVSVRHMSRQAKTMDPPDS
jgi:toxin ParE1/3/4